MVMEFYFFSHGLSFITDILFAYSPEICRLPAKKEKLKALNSLSEQFTFNNRLKVCYTESIHSSQ